MTRSGDWKSYIETRDLTLSEYWNRAILNLLLKRRWHWFCCLCRVVTQVFPEKHREADRRKSAAACGKWRKETWMCM